MRVTPIALSAILFCFQNSGAVLPENLFHELQAVRHKALEVEAGAHASPSLYDRVFLGPGKGRMVVRLGAGPENFLLAQNRVRDLARLMKARRPEPSLAERAAWDRELLKISDTFLRIYPSDRTHSSLQDGRAHLDARMNRTILAQAQLIGTSTLIEQGFWDAQNTMQVLADYLKPATPDSLEGGHGAYFVQRFLLRSNVRIDIQWLAPLLQNAEQRKLAVYFVVAPPSHGRADLRDFSPEKILRLVLDGRLRWQDLARFENEMNDRQDRRFRYIAQPKLDPKYWLRPDGERMTQEERFFMDLEEVLQGLALPSESCAKAVVR
jgi:hypothetical protein